MPLASPRPGRRAAAPAGVLLAAMGFAAAAQAPGDDGLRLAGMKLSTSLMLQVQVQHSTLAADSAVNPGNALARLPASGASLELRPVLRLDAEGAALRLFVEPRLSQRRERTAVAGAANTTVSITANTTDAWVQAWGLRWLPTETLSLQLGRDVLQWGPAASLSPSNPLYTDNGKANPYAELPGTELAQLQWFAAPGLTLSLVDNFGAGRQTPPLVEALDGGFRRTRLAKLDLSGDDSLASLNLAWTDGRPKRLGFYAQKTASDALLLYAEGGYSLRSTQRVADPVSSTWTDPARHRPSGLTLLGAAYTLATGPTVSVELLHNSQGWSGREAAAADALVRQAGSQLDGPGAALAAQQLGIAAEPGSPLLRRRYAFLQYHHPALIGELDLTLRATHNLDDGSNRFSLTCESPLGRRYTLFCQFLADTGGSGSEFGRYLRRQVLLGARVAW